MQDQIVSQFGDDKLIVLGLTSNQTTLEWLNEYVNNNNITFDILYSADDVFNLYGVYGIPTHILIDKQGQIRFRDTAYYFNRIGELITKIQNLIDE